MNRKRLEVKTNYPRNLSYLIQYLREELSKNNDPVFKNTYDEIMMTYCNTVLSKVAPYRNPKTDLEIKLGHMPVSHLKTLNTRMVRNSNAEKDLDIINLFKDTNDSSDTQWDNDQKSQYIESIMISGINQYFIIFDQDPEDYFEKELRYIIIDGNKRANVINEFYNGGLTLSGLKNFKLFNGLTVSDIPQEFLDHSFNSVQITTIVAHE